MPWCMPRTSSTSSVGSAASSPTEEAPASNASQSWSTRSGARSPWTVPDDTVPANARGDTNNSAWWAVASSLSSRGSEGRSVLERTAFHFWPQRFL